MMTMCFVAAACSSSADSTVVAPAVGTDVVDEASTLEPATTTTETPASVVPTTSVGPPQLIEDVTGDATEESFTSLPAGRYSSDLLPIEFSIELPEPAVPEFVELGTVYIVPAESEFEALAILAPTRLAGPASIPGTSNSPETWVDVPDDLGSWLSEVDELTITASG